MPENEGIRFPGFTDWKKIFEELQEEGFKCKYGKVNLVERTVYEINGEDGERYEVSADYQKNCFDLFALHEAYLEQYIAFINGYPMKQQRVLNIEDNLQYIGDQLRILKKDCPIIQRAFEREAQNPENIWSKNFELIKKRRDSLFPKDCPIIIEGQ